ncbi:MAG: hypothetical protein LBP94_02805 [Zoogloeaceae bacterium]|nr:hypothetical protein [Zoogloeaceae bacterium]
MKTRLGIFAFIGLTAFLTATAGYADPQGGPRSGGRPPSGAAAQEGDGMRAERMGRMHRFRRHESALGRMSPEECRQLRLEIRAAREGIYQQSLPPPPPPPAPPPSTPEP